MKKFLLFIGLLLAQGLSLSAQQSALDRRVDNLLQQLTLEEKLSLLQHRNPAIPRLGIPAYSWWNEALHGVGRNGLATVWPMPVALAATFDTLLVRELFAQVAYEAHQKFLPDSAGVDYKGLTFFTPNINIFRDPRWGRGMETYGEDPFLTAHMGLACVMGLQHGRSDGKGFAGHLLSTACLKHLAVHSGPEGIRHQFDAGVSPRDLRCTYLPAFEYIIRHSDVQQVMCGYNRLNGTPCCTNRELLVDILRNEWHYDGLLVTDCWALNDCWERDPKIPRHETHTTAAQAAADAFGSEVDLECGSGLEALKIAVDSGWVSATKVDEHVRRVLRTRLRVLPFHDGVYEPVSAPGGEGSLALLQAASECLVLLKNNALLPLNDKTTIYVAGPNASDSLMPLGNYNGTPLHTVTLYEGLQQQFTLVSSPSQADVIVYAGGLSPQLEGEELPVEKEGFYKGDRTRIELPVEQVEELRNLRQHGKPVVLLLCSGSALALDGPALQCEVILQCWYGGEAMGTAVAQALAGRTDCFGRLPVTFYKSTSQLPPFSDYSMQGRTYRYLHEEPLYPFGYGLNYARFSLDSLHYDAPSNRVGGIVRLVSTVTPDVPTATVVQLYWQRQLVGFAKVRLAPHQRQAAFSITIDPFWLRQFDDSTQAMRPLPDGTPLQFQIGFSSAPRDLTTLPQN